MLFKKVLKIKERFGFLNLTLPQVGGKMRKHGYSLNTNWLNYVMRGCRNKMNNVDFCLFLGF